MSAFDEDCLGQECGQRWVQVSLLQPNGNNSVWGFIFYPPSSGIPGVAVASGAPNGAVWPKNCWGEDLLGGWSKATVEALGLHADGSRPLQVPGELIRFAGRHCGLCHRRQTPPSQWDDAGQNLSKGILKEISHLKSPQMGFSAGKGCSRP